MHVHTHTHQNQNAVNYVELTKTKNEITKDITFQNSKDLFEKFRGDPLSPT